MRDDSHVLSGAYVLDALSEAERDGFERHLQHCPLCTDEVRGLRETAARARPAQAPRPPAAAAVAGPARRLPDPPAPAARRRPDRPGPPPDPGPEAVRRAPGPCSARRATPTTGPAAGPAAGRRPGRRRRGGGRPPGHPPV